MPKRSSRPRDTNELAKYTVDLVTGEEFEPAQNKGKDAAAVSLGRRGGLKGGRARAEKLSPELRAEIARKAAAKRWSSNPKV